MTKIGWTMSHLAREKFATQVDREILDGVRRLSRESGRQIQSLMDEALRDLVEKHRRTKPRQHVLQAYSASHDRFGPLYKNLAK